VYIVPMSLNKTNIMNTIYISLLNVILTSVCFIKKV